MASYPRPLICPFLCLSVSLSLRRYDATDSVYGRVHCRLAWSKDVLSGWAWVEGPGGLTGRDLIPLGRMGPPGTPQNEFDSHLCFASRPVSAPDGERIYYAGSNGQRRLFVEIHVCVIYIHIGGTLVSSFPVLVAGSSGASVRLFVSCIFA